MMIFHKRIQLEWSTVSGTVDDPCAPGAPLPARAPSAAAWGAAYSVPFVYRSLIISRRVLEPSDFEATFLLPLEDAEGETSLGKLEVGDMAEYLEASDGVSEPMVFVIERLVRKPTSDGEIEVTASGRDFFSVVMDAFSFGEDLGYSDDIQSGAELLERGIRRVLDESEQHGIDYLNEVEIRYFGDTGLFDNVRPISRGDNALEWLEGASESCGFATEVKIWKSTAPGPQVKLNLSIGIGGASYRGDSPMQAEGVYQPRWLPEAEKTSEMTGKPSFTYFSASYKRFNLRSFEERKYGPFSIGKASPPPLNIQYVDLGFEPWEAFNPKPCLREAEDPLSVDIDALYLKKIGLELLVTGQDVPIEPVGGKFHLACRPWGPFPPQLLPEPEWYWRDYVFWHEHQPVSRFRFKVYSQAAFEQICHCAPDSEQSYVVSWRKVPDRFSDCFEITWQSKRTTVTGGNQDIWAWAPGFIELQTSASSQRPNIGAECGLAGYFRAVGLIAAFERFAYLKFRAPALRSTISAAVPDSANSEDFAPGRFAYVGAEKLFISSKTTTFENQTISSDLELVPLWSEAEHQGPSAS